MTTMLLNQELNGIELYFDNKPMQNILNSLKECGFRWSNFKKCWYAKQSEKTLTEANKYIEEKQEVKETTTEVKAEKKQKSSKEIKITSLYERIAYINKLVEDGKPNKENIRDYRYVGSNYTGLSTKDTAKEIRQILKATFPEVKFSITSDYNRIDIEIKSSPYCNEKPKDKDISPYDYREFKKNTNKELTAIVECIEELLSSYNYDDSDSQSDYFNRHFYDNVSIDYEYIQTEQTEIIKKDILEFRLKIQQEEQAEEERKEKEYQEYKAKQEENHKAFLIRQEEEKQKIEYIYNSIDITELETVNQYFVIGSEFANINKNCTFDEYKEEVNKGEFELNNVKITKEVHFKNEKALNYFSNMLLNDFDFLAQTGGSYTDDKRINSMIDYDNMTKEERETVVFNLLGVAIYLNNELQFVVDAQGFSYARYVGLVNNATIQKEYNTKQVMTPEEVELLKDKAETIIDYSTNIITDLDIVNSWNNENWKEYKELMKEEFKNHNIKLSRAIIQQVPEGMESFKSAMYNLLTEVDGIQDQFKNADLKQGQKYTMFYMSDFGGVATNRMTFDKVEYTKYAQYDNAVKITYKPENKRSLYYTYKHDKVLVFNGWLDLPTEVLHTVEHKNGMTITATKYGSCDYKQFDDIISYFENQGIKPIINTYKPMF